MFLMPARITRKLPKMNITLIMNDVELENLVMVTKENIDYLPDFAELLLQFTRAIGYNYVKTVELTTEDGKT